MLEPRSRQLFYDALRVPEGYSFTSAVGTTYSLDLLALLAAPLAFTGFAVDDERREPLSDGLSVLEAVRRHADHIHLFCQAGRIAFPGRYRGLITFLEDSVHEVVLPDAKRVFHPKVWVLRFDQQGGDQRRYRLLCLTRNLTFARDWDTMLVLEGALKARRNGFSRNAALSVLLETLPKIVKHPLHPGVGGELGQMARDVSRVDFELQEEFASYRFHLLGVKGAKARLFPVRSRRSLVVSPFVSARRLRDFAGGDGADVLISRWDQLDALPEESVQAFAEVYALDPSAAAEPLEADQPIDVQRLAAAGDEPAASEERGAALDGLHAKLYVLDDGWEARLWTGSPNATNAAYGGNVEFLVELAGRRSVIGIEKILGSSGATGGLRDMLRPYTRGALAPVSADEMEAQELAEATRTALSRLPFVGRVETAGRGGRDAAEKHMSAETNALKATYRLTVATADESQVVLESGVSARCWPITLGRPHQVDLQPGSSVLAAFVEVSFAALTTFIAVEVKAACKSATTTSVFVVSAPLENAPADRRAQVLRSMLTNADDVLRFLLLLLAEVGGDMSAIQDALTGEGAPGGSWARSGSRGLLEAMLRALSRSPAQLDTVATFIRDLAGEEGSDVTLLPKGFAEVWEPIQEVRRRMSK